MTDNPLTSQWFTMHYGDGCIGIAPCHVPLPSFEWIGCCSSLAMICYYGSALLLSHSLVEASMLQVSCYFVMVVVHLLLWFVIMDLPFCLATPLWRLPCSKFHAILSWLGVVHMDQPPCLGMLLCPSTFKATKKKRMCKERCGQVSDSRMVCCSTPSFSQPLHDITYNKACNIPIHREGTPVKPLFLARPR